MVCTCAEEDDLCQECESYLESLEHYVICPSCNTKDNVVNHYDCWDDRGYAKLECQNCGTIFSFAWQNNQPIYLITGRYDADASKRNFLRLLDFDSREKEFEEVEEVDYEKKDD